jgi:hypothetical protein
MTGIRTRLSVLAMLLLVAVLATAVWMMSANTDPSGPRTLNVQLLNKNDGKDNCPTDGNAGKGNDGKCQPPTGSYGSVNPNDGKDNCPTDGNAGKGNDNKGAKGGCRTK